MRGQFAWSLVGGCIAAALISFAVVYVRLESQRVRFTPSHAAYFASDLLTCTKANAREDSLQKCSNAVKQLITVIAQVDPSHFEYYRRERFEVFRTGRLLTLYRKPCTDADVAIDDFAVNAWPLDSGGEGVGKVSSFSKQGFRVDNACVIVIEIPFENSPKFYIGQLDSNRKYAWVASYP